MVAGIIVLLLLGRATAVRTHARRQSPTTTSTGTL